MPSIGTRTGLHPTVPVGSRGMSKGASSGATEVVIQAHTAIVDAGGDGDYLTLAAAEAALTAPFSVLVKYNASAYAGAALAKTPAVWVLEPGVAIDGTTTQLNPTGADIAIIAMTGCDFQNAAINWDGADGYLEMRNGVDTDGLDFAGARMFATGGGWGSIMDGGTAREGLKGYSDDSIYANLDVRTTTGATGEPALEVGADRTNISGVKVNDSEERGIVTISTETDTLTLGSIVIDSDQDGIFVQDVRHRVIGNNVGSTDGQGVNITGTGDNSVSVGNVIDDTVNLNAGAADSVFVANRVDTTLTDGGAGTVDANDTEAF